MVREEEVKAQPKRFEEHDLGDLIDKFLRKDSV